MRRILLLCCVVLGGTILTPCSSFSLMHISNSNMAWECAACHPGGVPANGWYPCETCHRNSSGGGYTDDNTIEMATHSSAVIGSDKYAPWERQCLDCHDNHLHNGITKDDGIIDQSFVLADITVDLAVNDFTIDRTTFNSLQINNIYDPDWADPATWGEKTGPERGLLFVAWISSKYQWFEITNATDTTMTIGNAAVGFPSVSNPISGKLAYGMLIRSASEPINGTAVKFGGPKTMAHNDELGPDGNDLTPDGICQVCHENTTHWRSDGSLGNHFSGWNCIMCHPHEQGFKPVIPLLCPPPSP